MRFFLTLTAGIVIGAIASVAAYHADFLGVQSAIAAVTEPSSADGDADAATEPSTVIALGTIEPAKGVVNIASPLVGRRIEFVNARVAVEADEILVKIDRKLGETEQRIAGAQLAEAETQQSLSKQLAQDQIDSANKSLDLLDKRTEREAESQKDRAAALNANIEQAKRDHGRLRDLREADETLASEQDIEHAALAIHAAEAELDEAETAYFRAQQAIATQRDAASKQLAAATRQLEAVQDEDPLAALKNAKHLADLKLAQADVTSPISGTIIKRFARRGQLVGQSPLFQIADLDDLVCVVEVEAADIRRITVDMPVNLECDAWNDQGVTGQVESIGNVVGDAAFQPMNPLEPVKRHVVEVVVRFTLPASVPDERALLGVPVRATFNLNAGESSR